jgi:hypothetical protein
VELNPEFQNAWIALARMLFESGRGEELADFLKSHEQDIGRHFYLWMHCRLSILGGDLEQAAAHADELLSIAVWEYRSLVQVAILYAFLKADERAAGLLATAHERGDPILASPLYFFRRKIGRTFRGSGRL